MMIKFMCFAVSLFLVSLSALGTISEPNYNITVKTDFLFSRSMVQLKLSNTTNKELIVRVTPHENSTVGRIEEKRLILGAGHSTIIMVPLSFETSQRNQRFFVFQLDIKSEDQKGNIAKSMPVYQLIEKTLEAGNVVYKPIEEVEMMRKLVRPNLVERAIVEGEGSIDRGAGLIETVKAPTHSFQLTEANDLDPNRLPPIERDRTFRYTPREMADMFPLGTVGGNRTQVKSLYSVNGECDQSNSGCKQGVLLYKTFNFFSAAKYHLAYGFAVEMWQLKKLALGITKWELVGDGEVDAGGVWKIKPKVGYDSSALKMFVFKMGNRFFTMMNPTIVDNNYKASPYTWVAFAQPKKNVDGTWTEGTTFFKALDLPAGSSNGLHKIFSSGMKMWAKLVQYKINPIPYLFSIKMFFPNKLTNPITQCSSKDAAGNKIAWSCSTGAFGDLWLIPEHAEWETAVHELAHTINKNLWKGYWPNGASGSHAADKCYSPALAMTEGFANFLPLWVNFSSNEKVPQSDRFGNMETWFVACEAGKMNELSVTATLWDLYDRQNETSADPLKYDNYTHGDEGTTVVDYLSKSEDHINQYRYYIMEKSPMPQQMWIYDLFALNGTLVK